MRQHYFRYRLRRRPRKNHEALSFGTLWHAGQQAWWSCDGDAADRFDCAVHDMRNHAQRLVSGENEINPYALVTVEELMLGYSARWGEERYSTVAVERSFEVPLINPETGAPSRTFKLGGKFDGIVRDAAGALHGLEHKTTGGDIEIGSLFWEKVRALDTQVSLYDAGAKASGFDVVDWIYDVVRKPGIKPLKATPEESRKYKKDGTLYANMREHDETPEEFRARLREDIEARPDRYFARGTLVRLEDEARDHAFDVWQAAKSLHESERAQRAPKNPDSCQLFGGCTYLRVCSKQASIDDERLFRTADTAHEELQPEKEIA
jgi:hypothetical protein